MAPPRVENPAITSTLIELVTIHDMNQKPHSSFRHHRLLQDFATVRYSISAQREADDQCCTSITLKSTWPKELEVDTTTVARHLQRAAPGNLVLQATDDDTVTVRWLLSGGLYLDEPQIERTRNVIAWISKLGFGSPTLEI